MSYLDSTGSKTPSTYFTLILLLSGKARNANITLWEDKHPNRDGGNVFPEWERAWEYQGDRLLPSPGTHQGVLMYHLL